MSNQPVYRRPRSHAYSCRCPRCGTPAGSGLIGFDMIAIAAMFLIVAVIWIVTAPLRIWHVIGSDGQEHPDTATWIAYGAGGAVIMAVLMFFSIRATRGTPR